MKVILYILAGLLLIAPILIWGYLDAMSCAYQTNSIGCNTGLHDFLEADFLILAALPWMFSLVCLFFAIRKR